MANPNFPGQANPKIVSHSGHKPVPALNPGYGPPEGFVPPYAQQNYAPNPYNQAPYVQGYPQPVQPANYPPAYPNPQYPHGYPQPGPYQQPPLAHGYPQPVHYQQPPYTQAPPQPVPYHQQTYTHGYQPTIHYQHPGNVPIYTHIHSPPVQTSHHVVYTQPQTLVVSGGRTCGCHVMGSCAHCRTAHWCKKCGGTGRKIKNGHVCKKCMKKGYFF